ncbi:hypothetical protein BCIN_08g02930 [Botrytis cinerea B05.10]|uniref:Glycosyl transferase CAP10 domain-containing protein n=3 Tax=Botryotinia fuckeliana TaxID=40559 RepID=A0A384JPV8_BOTFB|nr:hypothetical protein BCIN_08g02930 [Botrytis cinerea B05.10]ATZ52635.1 hypothetical protein BCIN_08g02930 [Botrytis cinerea B05.10]EMR86337.1 putative duf821 domain-containing protein [Botrytis cinerea BcDW1]
MAIFNDLAIATARRPYPFVLALLLTLLVFLYTTGPQTFSPAPPPRIYTPTVGHGSDVQQDSEYISGRFGFDGTWNYTRDYRNLFLTQEQCDVAFPGLFEEVERPVKLRKNKKVTKKELDDTPALNGFIRAMIFDQQLYIIDTSGKIYSRGIATLHALHRAMLTSPEPLPNIEFTMNVDDKMEGHPQWLYARVAKNQETWLMPEYGFWSWPETKIGSYGEMQMKAILTESEWPWSRKIDKLLWRGATMNLEVRKKFVNVTEGKAWADVKTLDWHNEGSMKNDLKSMDEHCQYKFLAHTEGNSYSARLKYLRNCRSVIVAHKLEWMEFFHPLMKKDGPEQNYIEVDREFEGLENKMVELIEKKDQKEVEEIAERSVRLFRERYLTPAAETCYWRRLIRGWKEVMGFEVEFFNVTKSGEKKWRGVPVESFLLERRLEWDPY